MKHFEYIKWYIGHDKDLPAFIIYEIDLDNERYATRMANIFADRTVIPVIEEGFDFITEAPIPTIDEINQEKDYFAEIISKEEFEKIYCSEKYSGKLNTTPHSTLQTPHLKR